MPITAAMTALAAHIQKGTERHVTTDPRNVSPPCVLIEPPTLDPSGTACGSLACTWRVLVIGLPGAWAELAPLALLLAEVLDVLPGWTLAEPVGYVPLADAGSADPCQAYRVTVDTYEEI